MLPVVTVLAAMLSGGVAVAQDLPRGGDITCEGPFSSKDTGESLLARFGPQAGIMEVPDLSGEAGDTLVLYPGDRSARLEAGDANGNGTGGITSLTVKGPDTVWTVGGLRIGTSLNKLTDINGGPLKLTGFWQEQETVFTMTASMPLGECNVDIVMFAPDGMTTMHPLYGLENIQSNDPRLGEFRLKIDQLIIMWPEETGED